MLALLSTFGGFFLIPAVLVWMALVATEPPSPRSSRKADTDGEPLIAQPLHE